MPGICVNVDGGFTCSPSLPLIVALVAAGVIALTMISTFEWRRRQRDRTGVSQGGRPGDDQWRLADPEPGERPKMWDIEIHAKGSPLQQDHQQQQEQQWDEIMPIAVTMSEEAEVQPCPTPRCPTRWRLFQPLRWLCRRRRRETFAEAEQDEQQNVVGEKAKGPPPRKDVQVVVAIAMPYRPRQVSLDSSTFNNRELWRENRADIDYSIGLYTCSWYGKG